MPRACARCWRAGPACRRSSSGCTRAIPNARVIAGHAARRTAGIHAVRACPALDDALSGAAAVVLLIRVGGMAARARDEELPTRYGLVGDEGVGVGGMANAWRTLPVLDRVADRIAACAPGAAVLNMMAPLGVTTRLLVERGHRAVGLCELPAVTLARWTHASGSTQPLCYAGMNHLGFWWSPDMRAEAHPVLRAAIESGEVPRELARQYDAAPLHYFVDVFAAPGRKRMRRARELAAHHPAGRAVRAAPRRRDRGGGPARDALVPARARAGAHRFSAGRRSSRRSICRTRAGWSRCRRRSSSSARGA